MEHTETDFEQKFFYRLVKASFVIAFIFFSLIVIFIGWYLRPTTFLDNQKSQILCYNSKNYSLDKAQITLSSKTSSLTRGEETIARKLCAYGVENNYSSEYYNLKTPPTRNFELDLEESTHGSWNTTAWVWILGVLVVYVALHLIKETLLYVFLGKKLSWGWLQNLWSIMTS